MVVRAVSTGEAGTVALGRAVGRVVCAGDVVALEGELGAGKTRFVRGVCDGMGLDPAQVSSPTFVVVNEYGAAKEGAAATGVLRHVDAYRLGGVGELESVGWDRVVDGTAVVVIEWASRVGIGDTEQGVARVRIESGEGEESGGAAERIEREAEGRGERVLTMDVPDAWALRPGWDELMRAWGAKGRVPEGWVRCPTTGKPVPPEWPTFPFIDEKSRLADLGKWMTGSYTISREIKPEDVGEE